MNKTIITVVAVVVVLASVYFLYFKGTTSKDAQALTDTQVKALTDAQIEILTLDQIKALSFDQLSLLTPYQANLLQTRKAKLQAEKDAADKAAAEAARIAELKTKMGKITPEMIWGKTVDFTSFTDEAVSYLPKSSQLAYKVVMLPQGQKDACYGYMAAIYEDIRGINSHTMGYYQESYDFNDEMFYYAVKVAWPNISNKSLIDQMNSQSWGNLSKWSKNRKWTADKAKALIAKYIDRIKNLP